jgi:hypothetical protein
MKRNKIVLGVGVIAAVLALSMSGFAQALHVAVEPSTATVIVGQGPQSAVNLDAFCSFTPCNITWTVILSDSNVGSINNTTGPTSTFVAGTTPGKAHIIVSDGNGHMAEATVTVQQGN